MYLGLKKGAPLDQEGTWEQPPLFIFRGSWGPDRAEKMNVLVLGGYIG